MVTLHFNGVNAEFSSHAHGVSAQLPIMKSWRAHRDDRERCTKWIGKPDKITKIVTVNENYIHLIMIHLFTESIYIFWVDAKKKEQENNCNLVRALEIRDANFWQYHTCCSMTTRAIAAWTTFVRSKQSIQFTLKIPSCLQISPAWSTLCWHKKTKIPLCYHHSHNSLA